MITPSTLIAYVIPRTLGTPNFRFWLVFLFLNERFWPLLVQARLDLGLS